MTGSTPPPSQCQRIIRIIALVVLLAAVGLLLVKKQKYHGETSVNHNEMNLNDVHVIRSSVLDDLPDCNYGEDNDDNTCSIPKSLPVGATYNANFDFPMLGHYTVKLRIQSASTAQLLVEGGFPIQDELQYKLIVQPGVADPASKVLFSVQLSDYLDGVLERFWVTLSEIQYDPIADAPSVTVEIAHVITFSLKLER